MQQCGVPGFDTSRWKLTARNRLETIRDFDEIVVLDEGIVVENGSFESLLEGGGLFSKMYFAYQESTKDGL